MLIFQAISTTKATIQQSYTIVYSDLQNNICLFFSLLVGIYLLLETGIQFIYLSFIFHAVGH